MAKSQLEIVVIDENGPTPFDQPAQGGGFGSGSGSGGPTVQPQRPGEPVRGPRRRSEEDGTVLGALGNLGKLGAEALGLGGLLGSSLKLAKAFAELFQAVMRSAHAHQQEAATVGPQARRTRPGEIEVVDITGPEPSPKTGGPKPSGPDVRHKGRDVIEGEFEIKGPKASDRALSIPKPTGVSGPVRSTVETVGVQERLAGVPAVIKPTVSGPPAGAGAVAGPSAEAAATSVASGMSRIAAAAGPLAIAFAATAAAVVAVVAPFYLLKKAFDVLGPQVQKLEGLSGPLASAAAQSDVRMEMAEMRRAQRIGPDLAKFERTRGRGEEALYDLGTQLLSVIVQLVNKAEPAINVAIKGLGIVEVSIPVLVEIVTLIHEVLSADRKGSLEANERLSKLLANLPFEIAKQLADDSDDLGPDPYFAAFFDSVAKATGGMPEPWGGVAPDRLGGFSMPPGRMP